MAVARGSGTWTVLFTDLVGSTELRTRVGDDAADDLRATHDRLLGEAVEANEGEVIKGLGDGVMAAFPGAADAVACAVAMQQAVDLHNRTTGATLGLKIGVSVGDARFEGGDLFGTPVIEASRLCSVATGGQILCSDVVRAIAGSRGGHRYNAIGALDLKGLPAPVPACAVVWEPLPIDLDRIELPVPRRLLRRTPTPFVSRSAELEALLTAWTATAEGASHLVLLSGPSGMGKSRLAMELARRAFADGATVLHGSCPATGPEPFDPVVDALRHLLGEVPAAVVPEVLGPGAGELVRVIPRLAELLPPERGPSPVSDPTTARFRLFQAFAGWVAAVGEQQPVVLVLEDLHWAAPSAIDLIGHLHTASANLPLLIVGTYRESSLGRRHDVGPQLTRLRRLPRAVRIPVRGLTPAGVVALAEAIAGHPLDPAGLGLARALHSTTDGNPFFLEQTLRHLGEEGVVYRSNGRWTTDLSAEAIDVPESIFDVIGRRLDRLSSTANEILAAAATLGRESSFGAVAHVTAKTLEVVRAAVAEAVDAGLVDDGEDDPRTAGRVRFSHDLVRETLVSELRPGRAAILHQRALDALERSGRLTALAHHAAYSPASASDAARWASAAGRRALDQLAHEAAALLYRDALDLIDAADPGGGGTERVELLLGLGEALRRDRDPAARRTLVSAARLAEQLDDADTVAFAALALARDPWTGGRLPDQERIDILEVALASVGDGDIRLRARLLAGLAAELSLTTDRQRMLAIADKALSDARAGDDDATLVDVLGQRILTIVAPDTLDERLTESAELVAVAGRGSDSYTFARASLIRADVALEAGDVAESVMRLGHAEAVVQEIGQPALRWRAAVRRAAHTALTGALAEAEEQTAAALELGRAAAEPEAGAVHTLQLFGLRREQDRAPEMEGTIVAAAAGHAGDPLLRAVLALQSVELGRMDDARTLLRTLAEHDLADVPRDVHWTITTAVAAEVAHALGEDALPVATVLRDLLEPYAGRLASNGWTVFGSVARALALVCTAIGRDDEAGAHFAHAVQQHAAAGAAAWAARTRVDWAHALAARGTPADRDRARHLLDEATASAQAQGFASVERRAWQVRTLL